MDCFGLFKRRRRGGSLPNSQAASLTTSSSTSTNGAGGGKSGESSSATAAKGGRTSKSSSGSTGSSQQSSLPAMFEEKASGLRVFGVKELRSATNDFSALLKIGEGGFGTVFKGSVKPSGGKGKAIAVAVKRLNQQGSQGHKQWLAEVQFLGVVEHKNLVKLIGFCSQDGERGIQRLLVYEFMPNKSLEAHLFNKAYPCLPWDRRMQIALGAAEGLAYLHEGLGVELIYRDFKASNILLDEDFNPKLSDFGLAREGPVAGNTHVSTAVMGTYGYAAPEYVATGHLTTKCDVWSFGVVMLEILCGRRSVERNRPRNEQKLLDWVQASNSLGAIMDPRLENQFPMRSALEVAKLANSCLNKRAKDRPTMSQVVEALKQAMQIINADGGSGEFMEENVFSDVSKADEAGPTESFRRRILHLAKLKQPSTNATGFRKMELITLLKADDS